MARIQIVPLPAQRTGDYEHIPFILILDQIDPDDVWRPEDMEILKHETAAVTVIGYEGTLDAPGALQLTEEQQADMIRYLTEPRRWVTSEKWDGLSPEFLPTTSTLLQNLVHEPIGGEG